MVRILSEPKNALTRQYQKLFELDNVKLEFTREALEEIAQLAVDRKIGARGLRSILETVIMRSHLMTQSESAPLPKG